MFWLQTAHISSFLWAWEYFPFGGDRKMSSASFWFGTSSHTFSKETNTTPWSEHAQHLIWAPIRLRTYTRRIRPTLTWTKRRSGLITKKILNLSEVYFLDAFLLSPRYLPALPTTQTGNNNKKTHTQPHNTYICIKLTRHAFSCEFLSDPIDAGIILF